VLNVGDEAPRKRHSKQKICYPYHTTNGRVATGNLEEKKEMKFTKFAIFATLLTMASTTFAATQAANTNTVSPTLQISATVQDAVQLTLSTGTALAGGASCTINPGGGDYQMSFGNVDALAINPATCGNKYLASGGSNTVYYTDYQVTPTFTSQPNNTAAASVKAYMSASTLTSNVGIVRDTANTGTNPADATGFTAMPTTLATAYSIATGPLTSGTALHPFVGVTISNANGASMTGAQTATITYVLTVN
jgi:hypothetical protein